MRGSRIFTNAELLALDRRLKGDRRDPYGLFARRIKPKIQELLCWANRTLELKKAIEPVRKKGTGQ